MKRKSFDLIVLGAGSGGIATAVRAASYGATVAVVESSHLGGTCVNVGCVPKKVMFNASMIADALVQAVDYGFSYVTPKLNWKNLVIKRTAYIERLRHHYRQRLEQLNIVHIKGIGCFHDAHQIRVNDLIYSAKHIVIATGGTPSVPTIKGIQHVIDSDGFFALTKKPKKVAIIGSGYIGVEIAGVLNGLGTETHLLMRGEMPLSRFDNLLGETLLESMKQQGILIHPHHKAHAINLHSDGRKSIVCESGSILRDVDVIICAIGRDPRTQHLNLNSIGVKTDDKGLIWVDPFQNTSVEGVYAIGDVTNAPALTPVAIAAGRRLADRLFGLQPEACLNYDNISSVVFSHPPVGSIGFSERDAIEQYGKEQIKVYKTRFYPMHYALSDTKIPTAMKLVTLGQEEKIIGLHVIGHCADEMLQGFAVAVKMGACKKDFDNTVAIHPTSAEEFVTMV